MGGKEERMANKKIAVPTDTDGPRFRASSVPSHVRTNLAQVAHDAILQSFQDPAVRADYERWKSERDMRRATV